ncbi:52 kDa repressor of the inhibitor of the protein kinase [Mizuhopecten yessoensis]|uniref:52 kDa repressor of the inhibitor of the protein kinase n=1 Tax=Mizuhopecten yessoensis TaxID=6573 RepID=A0A210R5F7_MIZYE|nr:52 kDa repressor of the inhibitor of the protein kinase [Mizuhopecten yessoensis]
MRRSGTTSMQAADNRVFERELQRWIARWENVDDKPTTLADTLASIKEPLLYPNIYRCIEVLLSMPVASASAERSFSLMRRLKTYLRSRMDEERMSSLALLHAYREYDIDINWAIAEFAGRKARRLCFLFRE